LSVSCPLLGGYDEPETLSYQITLFGPISADVKHYFLVFFVSTFTRTGARSAFKPTATGTSARTQTASIASISIFLSLLESTSCSR
jgi:hypothetical protein